MSSQHSSSVDASGPSRRLAVLGDSSTQFLARAIRNCGTEERINFDIFEADFDQLGRQILDAGSELYQFKPEYMVLFPCSERLWERFCAVEQNEKEGFAEHILSEIQNWWACITRFSCAKIIQFNFVETSDAVFGHFAARTPASFRYQLARINLELMERAHAEKHLLILDLAGLAGRAGYEQAHDPRLYSISKMALTLDFVPLVAKAVCQIAQAASGRIKKCLILDLDDTLWGGVIGDDGMENIQIGELGMGHAYDAIQRWARELKRRGILLAVCSKNDEAVAKRPFLEHPDMTLRLDDFAIFIANWDSKAENIQRIQQVLNLGLDSMVFLDDSPFERNLVRSMLPAVTVPEIPEDPAMVLPCLCTLNLFETASFSSEDSLRTQQYQAEAARVEAQKTFASLDDYLLSLGMRSKVKPFDDFSIPRVAQLTQRSNQFNLRTIRYSEAEVAAMKDAQDFVTLTFQLRDRFGDHGLIGVVALNVKSRTEAFIDTWIMSCRVLKRGMEEFILNQMAGSARSCGVSRLVGEYIPTSKNGIVKDLYPQLGFAAHNGRWELDLGHFLSLKTFIEPDHEENIQ